MTPGEAQPKPMTKTEREDLRRLARERARVAKADAHRRTADLRAMFEQELLTFYDYNRDEIWAEAVAEARKAGEEAQAKVAKRCEELGIPPAFAPSVSVLWKTQGPAAVQYEQADLRRAAYERIEAQERAAIAEIDKRALEIQTELVVQGLTSDTAIGFLHSMPSVDELMPPVTVSRRRPGSAGRGAGRSGWETTCGGCTPVRFPLNPRPRTNY